MLQACNRVLREAIPYTFTNLFHHSLPGRLLAVLDLMLSLVIDQSCTSMARTDAAEFMDTEQQDIENDKIRQDTVVTGRRTEPQCPSNNVTKNSEEKLTEKNLNYRFRSGEVRLPIIFELKSYDEI